MPVRVTLIAENAYDYEAEPGAGDQEFVIKSRHDYAKVGFAAARWARAALRGAQLGEGGSNAELRMEIDFLGDEEPPPAEKPAKKARKRKGKANGAES